MFKRWGQICVIPALVLSFVLTGCGSDYDEIQVVRVWSEEEDGGEDAADHALFSEYKQKTKIGMVIDEGQADDDSFVSSACMGLSAVSQSAGVDTDISEAPSTDRYVESFDALAAENCGFCWGIGYNCGDALLESAVKNPGISYAIIDSAYEDTPDNVTGVVFRAQEPSFLVGYIAGAVTGTGKLGFVGGQRSETIDQFQYGFEAGARYAAAVYSKNVEIVVEYADSYADPDKGKQIAKDMYASGCDIIFHAAGGTGNGVIEAAKETGKFVIGVDQDQSYLAPKNVLTSALKKVDVAVERVSLSYIMGENIGGSTISFGLTEGAVGIPAEHENYRDEIYDAVLSIEDKIKSGQLKVPATKDDLDAFLNAI